MENLLPSQVTSINTPTDEIITIQRKPASYYTHKRIQQKLKEVLDSSVSMKIHTNKILGLPTLKDAHIYCKYNNLSGQFTGPVLEKYIQVKYKMTKNVASSCNGDLQTNNTNIEINEVAKN